MPSSSIPGFYEKTREERLDAVSEFAGLSQDERAMLQDPRGGVSFSDADRMIENAIGTFALPLGIATNFRINGRDCLIPMVIEESSVVAAASRGAKDARAFGGFSAVAEDPYSIGQIQIIGAESGAVPRITESSQKILELANSKSSTLPAIGRGAKEISCKNIAAPSGDMLIVELAIDVGDAMGANITNTMCETVAPLIERLSGGRALLRILSNYSTKRMVRASAIFDKNVVGSNTARDIVLAFEFADNDVYRAVTHNKGIMNGVMAVANATGQDGRAIEAAANAYATRTGRYRPLGSWSVNSDGNLAGTFEIPLAVGMVGGISNIHGTAKVCKKILGAASAQELACVMASVGLAQNYSALRALATDGIQSGHMRLHAQNLAAAAGATPEQITTISDMMISDRDISLGHAKELLRQI